MTFARRILEAANRRWRGFAEWNVGSNPMNALQLKAINHRGPFRVKEHLAWVQNCQGKDREYARIILRGLLLPSMMEEFREEMRRRIVAAEKDGDAFYSMADVEQASAEFGRIRGIEGAMELLKELGL